MGIMGDLHAKLTNQTKESFQHRQEVSLKLAKFERLLQEYKLVLADLKEHICRIEKTNKKKAFVSLDDSIAATKAEGEESLEEGLAITLVEDDVDAMETVQVALDIVYMKEQIDKLSQDIEGKAETMQEDIKQNLKQMSTKLDDMIRFVAKLDGSIIESVKANSEQNKLEIFEQLQGASKDSRKGKGFTTTLIVLSFVLNLACIAGVTVILLYLLDYIAF